MTPDAPPGPILIVEIKARCADPGRVRALLREAGAEPRGVDRQVDTYFRVPEGRLKLREGVIENHLIRYDRPDREGPKESRVLLYPTSPGSALKEILTRALGVLVVVDKRREISFIGNVKFHLDEVAGLGSFAEIEAIDAEGSIGPERLHAQCRRYLDLLGIRETDLVATSYSDLLLARAPH